MSELKNKVVYLHKINGEIVYVGKPMCKYFSFSTKKYFKNTGSYYGSKEEALNAAIMFRNTVVLTQHPQK